MRAQSCASGLWGCSFNPSLGTALPGHWAWSCCRRLLVAEVQLAGIRHQEQSSPVVSISTQGLSSTWPSAA